MDEKYYRHLVKRYLDGTATDDELEVFVHLLKNNLLDPYLQAETKAEIETGAEGGDETPAQPGRRIRRRTEWLKYAAAVLLVVSAAVLPFLRRSEKTPQVSVSRPLRNDVPPGGNKAVLTLANGQKIILDSQGNGTIARQGACHIKKLKGGHLVYQRESTTSDQTFQYVTYNTVNTPKGGQYTITLPDGSKAWLNSVSSIRFPTAFSTKERVVETTGEVYFEIAKDAERPFTVETGNQTVKVLGTRFNINAYEDEETVRTTLLEGSVQISAGSDSRILRPGQQSEVSGPHINIVKPADMQSAVAWKNGMFFFDNTDLTSLMRQLSRWYDITVIYNGKTNEHEFTGQIKRSARLSSVLKILGMNGVRFTLKDKNLYIQ